MSLLNLRPSRLSLDADLPLSVASRKFRCLPRAPARPIHFAADLLPGHPLRLAGIPRGGPDSPSSPARTAA
jgi:hypothetical protein